MMSKDVDEPIEIVSYDPAWPQLFAIEAGRLLVSLAEKVNCIEHIGSTSVPGMTGKPIVDLLVGVNDMAQAHRVAEEIATLGYENLGEVLVPGRVYLRRRGPPHFNVVIVVQNGQLWHALFLVRDYLRTHPDEVKAYSKTKMAAVESGATMFLSYSHEKGPFMAELVKRAVHWKSTGQTVRSR